MVNAGIWRKGLKHHWNCDLIYSTSDFTFEALNVLLDKRAFDMSLYQMQASLNFIRCRGRIKIPKSLCLCTIQDSNDCDQQQTAAFEHGFSAYLFQHPNVHGHYSISQIIIKG